MNDAITEAAPTLMSDQTLAYSNEMPEVELGESGGWRRTILIAVAILTLAGAIAGAAVFYASKKPAVEDLPTDPVDRAFIQGLRSSDVPIADWRYTLAQARKPCPEGPAGEYTITGMRNKAKPETGWTEAQTRRFVDAVVDTYCPQLHPPTPEALAAMLQEDRAWALLGSRLGLTRGTGMTEVAQGICADLARGYPYGKIVDETHEQNLNLTNWSRQDAATEVAILTSVYCP
ncbi:DUF732 domain-containing protein [Mycobacterium sp. CnD-18-1]|uniref:DUF732 domain-containing protein n=1 Tax=Mycobacterium sp. CnD-18-1 TaxID=2917744 RepID=UPI001EF33984|nr:DUF732 domain-containing protein [Mycobacterium sp. CnD-18-1]MCG7607108.1 DUF732 domain-containing protein [Mycobacterium sp. CnD-18-1]